MTRQEIEQLPAGREMDHAVLTKLGWECHFDSEKDDRVRYKRDNAVLWSGPFEPSTSPAAALAVVEFLDDVTIIREEAQYSVGVVISAEKQAWVNAKRAPVAICRAFLIASL